MYIKILVNVKTSITYVTFKVVVIVLIVISHLVNHNVSINTRGESRRVFLCEVHVVGLFSPGGESFFTSFTSAREGGSEKNARTCNIYLYV